MRTAIPRTLSGCFVLTTLIALIPDICSAGLIVAIDDTNASVPFPVTAQTGSFEVYVQSNLAPNNPELLEFQVVMEVSEPGITFTGAAVTTDHHYVLSTYGGVPVPDGLFGFEILDSGARIKGGDSGFFQSEPLVDGSGLLKITFEVAGGTQPGEYPVTFVMADPTHEMFLTDAGWNDLTFAPMGGMITVVPEPSTFVLAALGLLGLGLYAGRRRRV